MEYEIKDVIFTQKKVDKSTWMFNVELFITAQQIKEKPPAKTENSTNFNIHNKREWLSISGTSIS